jgi:uncharacterized membrane protein YoaK (UPF0700 family)
MEMERWPKQTFDLLLLTLGAGMLDALAYLRGRAFTANMTGNTVLLGLGLAAADRHRIVPCAIALVAFLAGAAGAALVFTRNRVPREPHEDLRYGLAMEVPLLIIFCGAWILSSSALIALAAGACALGIQSVAVRRLRISGVVTTFMTGTMTTAVVTLISRGESDPGSRDGKPLLLAAMLVIYVLAAATGAFLYEVRQTAACFFPLATAAIVRVRQLRR